ncbi:TPA: hypothetical protein N0F65_005509 [Lagenidium giganteum]|uniref:Centrosomal protein of 44 kDa n=1 Tax=Lagenidium giganteum TaxID=4803 RepID=A0AAV2YIL5_9STRA|nr:TPA: hypothetical protein N0F65_005509 [Lagenidium giganteum]
MAGDLHNAVGRLRAQLKRIRYPHVPAAIEDLARNDTLLRILHFTFLDYSRHLAQFVSSKGYDLYGATDARFVASLFRLLRDEFRLFPSLTSAQFLSNHHTERKLTLVADAIMMAQKQHGELVRSQRREEAKWTNPKRYTARDEA